MKKGEKDMDGIILIDKPLGYTSHDIVGKVRRVLHTKKVGHCGTLDPEASGVLVVCVNKATKALQFLTSEDKHYIATIKLGISTDTYDMTGTIQNQAPYRYDVSQAQLDHVLTEFQGKQKQIPPIYSAIKVNGKKLYEYARAGEAVEIQPRDIEIYSIECVSFKEDEIQIQVHCSKGTYIRSLCVDIACALGYPGCMSALKRTQSGPFKLEDCVSLEALENNQYEMIAIDEALAHLPSLTIEDEKIVYHGKTIDSALEGQIAIKNKEGHILAIYEQSGNHTLKNVRGLW